MKEYINPSDVPLGLAVWLVNDEYDYQSIPNYISATTLLKPIRQIILDQKLTDADRDPIDIASLIPSRMGTAIHDSVEKAWTQGNVKERMIALGIPENIADRVIVNPDKDVPLEDKIPIFLEKRGFAKVRGYTVGGKFDQCVDGIIHDVKSTSVYSYMLGSKDEDYMLQGSIYKYLFPDMVTGDFIRIMFVFTDWQSFNTKTDPTYPKSRIAYKDIPLMTHEQTHNWIVGRLDLIDKFKNAPDEMLPLCSPEELWLSETVYKYYADATKQGRATKNFTDYSEAVAYQQQKDKAGKGIIVTFKGEPKRCNYCPVFNICTQKDTYFNEQSGT